MFWRYNCVKGLTQDYQCKNRFICMLLMFSHVILGIYSNVSENTHWGEFLKASLQYVWNEYPRPWNEETEKLVVFIFGIASHQTADVLWHGLGVDHGFIETMAEVRLTNNIISVETICMLHDEDKT